MSAFALLLCEEVEGCLSRNEEYSIPSLEELQKALEGLGWTSHVRSRIDASTWHLVQRNGP